MRKFQQVAFVLVLLLLSLLIGAVPAMASSEFVDIFNSTYPNSQSANNASCRLCHTSSTSQLNQYGRDWTVQLRSGRTEVESFRDIEGASRGQPAHRGDPESDDRRVQLDADF